MVIMNSVFELKIRPVSVNTVTLSLPQLNLSSVSNNVFSKANQMAIVTDKQL